MCVQVGTAYLVDVLQVWLLGDNAYPRYVDDNVGPRSSAFCLPNTTQARPRCAWLCCREARAGLTLAFRRYA